VLVKRVGHSLILHFKKKKLLPFFHQVSINPLKGYLNLDEIQRPLETLIKIQDLPI
jgi:hypothetical protein